MGKFEPVLLACILNASGLYIFRKPEDFESLSYQSHIIFLCSMFCLLWDVSFYPSGFRKLYFWVDFILECLIGMFLIETIMGDFWVRLDESFNAAVPKMAELVELQVDAYDLRSEFVDKICNTLKSEEFSTILNYLFKIFFLFTIGHATRIVDFRILQCEGLHAFINDIKQRTIRFVTRKLGGGIQPNISGQKRNICCPPGTRQGHHSGAGPSIRKHCGEQDGCDSNTHSCSDCRNRSQNSYH